jgi:hypothetical protein
VVDVRRLAPSVTLFALGLWTCRLYQPFGRAITLDNQLYFYIAERVAAGVPPHVSLIDHKHALSAMLSGWAMLLGRCVGADDVVSVRLLSMVLAATLPATLWVLAMRLTRQPLVAHITAFVALSFDDFFVQAASGVRPQLFMAVFMVYSFAALGARRYTLAGASAVASFLCWQPALLVFAASSTAIALERSSKRALMRYVAGGIVVLLLYEGYFWWHGALREQLFQAYVMPSELGAYKHKPLWDGIVFVLRDGRWGAGWWVVIPAVYLVTVALSVLEPLYRWRPFFARLRTNALPGALTATSALALVFTLIDHQAYPDRYFLQPFIALANGLVWGGVISWMCEQTGPDRRVSMAVGLAVFVLGAVLVATDARTSYPGDRRITLAQQRELANRVAALRRQYGPVWAVGCAHLLALRRTGNYDFAGLVIDPKVRHYLQSMADEEGYRPGNGTMPVVILTSRGGEAAAFPWLRREYWPVPHKAFAAAGIRTWLRKECLVDRTCRALFGCTVRPKCWPRPENARSFAIR